MEYFRSLIQWFAGNSDSLSEAQKREVLNMLTVMQSQMQETSRAYVRGETYDLSERMRDNSAKLAKDQRDMKLEMNVQNAAVVSEVKFLKKLLEEERSSNKVKLDNFTREYDEQIKNMKAALHSLSNQDKFDEKKKEKEKGKTSKEDIDALANSLQNLMRAMAGGNNLHPNANVSPNEQFHPPPSNFNPSNPSHFVPLNPSQNLGPGPTTFHPFRPNHLSPNPPNFQNPSNFQPGGPWPNFQSPNFGPPHRFEGPSFRPNLPRGPRETFHARRNPGHINQTWKQETGYRHTNGRRGGNVHKPFHNKRNYNKDEQSFNFKNKKYDKESENTRNEQGTERNFSHEKNFSKATHGGIARKSDGNDSDASTTSGFSSASCPIKESKQRKHFNVKDDIKQRSDNLRDQIEGEGDKSDFSNKSKTSSSSKNKFKTADSSKENTNRRSKNFINQTDGDESDFSIISTASSNRKDKFKTADSSKENTKRRSKNPTNRTDGDESDFSVLSQTFSSRSEEGYATGKSSASQKNVEQKYESRNQSDDGETDFSTASQASRFYRNKNRPKTGKYASSKEGAGSENRRNQTDDNESDFSIISHASSSYKKNYKTLAETSKSNENKKEQRLKKLHRFSRTYTRESGSRNKDRGTNLISFSSESDSSVESSTKSNIGQRVTEKVNKSENDRKLPSNSSNNDIVKVSFPSREQASKDGVDLNKKFKNEVMCVSKVNEELISNKASCLAEIYAFEDRYGDCRVIRF